ncbi:MAG: hypothetical protein ACLGH8_13080 [Bacteroidia bacterium]
MRHQARTLKKNSRNNTGKTQLQDVMEVPAIFELIRKTGNHKRVKNKKALRLGKAFHWSNY